MKTKSKWTFMQKDFQGVLCNWLVCLAFFILNSKSSLMPESNFY